MKGKTAYARPPTWIFDLDNTLHDATAQIFPHINRSMTEYVARLLDIDEHAADRLREHYWKRYGATLVGLIRHHNVDPHHFLRATHEFPAIGRLVVARRELRWTLQRLPGEKLIFSNSPAHYSNAVLSVLGVSDLFSRVFTIEHTGFRPKPDVNGFRRILRARGLDPRRCIMVEDTLDNLRTAKRLGMRTVWIDSSTRAPCWIDLNVRHIAQLPARFRRWRAKR
jgi:putative hydrolase of the HAD superfamily